VCLVAVKKIIDDINSEIDNAVKAAQASGQRKADAENAAISVARQFERLHSRIADFEAKQAKSDKFNRRMLVVAVVVSVLTLVATIIPIVQAAI